MKLSQLDAQFLRYAPSDGHICLEHVETLAEAQGIIFLCPLCYAQNHGPVATHSVICWFADRGVPADAEPLPGRWRPSGTGIDDLTFVGPDAVSVQLLSGCNWHGFVSNGDAA
jgi:hypothetical protein